MTMTPATNSTIPERFLAPKQLPDALAERYGLRVSYRDIRRVRHAAVNDGLFVLGSARASDVFEWLKAHPGFASRAKVTVSGTSCAVMRNAAE
jgi:hypothetical protein